MIKIYIHHYYSEKLFIQFFHNSTNRVFNIVDRIGSVQFDYNGTSFTIVYNPKLNNNSDGYHLIDVWTAVEQSSENSDYSDVRFTDAYTQDISILHKIFPLVKNTNGWIITYFRTEKILGKYDIPYHTNSSLKPPPVYVEEILEKFSNHILVTDNMFLKDEIKSLYPNHYYAFTNSIFRWNHFIFIRWYYEFKQIFDKLNFDYDLTYSIRNHRQYRVDIMKLLSNLNNPKIYLQRTDTLINSAYKLHDSELKLDNIVMNSIEGYTDFSNLTIEGRFFSMDLFFRMLNKSKMQILDESLSFFTGDFYSQYLSEKTIGLVLAGIPFISTHTYPLEMLEKSLNIEPHPFMDDFRNSRGNPNAFVNFVIKFMENYDKNYILCKEWSDKCHIKMINRIETENSLLELFNNEFDVKIDKINKLI